MNPETMTAVDWFKLIGSSTILTLITLAVKPMWRQWKARQTAREAVATQHTLNAVTIVELKVQVASLLEDMNLVKSEVRYDKGDSLKDEVRSQSVSQRIDDALLQLAQGRATWRVRIGPKGEEIGSAVSQVWSRWTGLGSSDMHHGGWARCVDHGEYPRVVALVDEAWKKTVIYGVEFTCVNVLNGTPFRVKMVGAPVLDAKHQLIGWVAELTAANVPQHRIGDRVILLEKVGSGNPTPPLALPAQNSPAGMGVDGKAETHHADTKKP